MVHAHFPHFVQYGDRIDGLGEIEHGIDGFIDLPILLEVKILRAQNADHIGDALAVDEDRAQHRLLRFQGLGRLTGYQFFIHSLFTPFGNQFLTPRRS